MTDKQRNEYTRLGYKVYQERDIFGRSGFTFFLIDQDILTEEYYADDSDFKQLDVGIAREGIGIMECVIVFEIDDIKKKNYVSCKGKNPDKLKTYTPMNIKSYRLFNIHDFGKIEPCVTYYCRDNGDYSVVPGSMESYCKKYSVRNGIQCAEPLTEKEKTCEHDKSKQVKLWCVACYIELCLTCIDNGLYDLYLCRQCGLKPLGNNRICDKVFHSVVHGNVN